VNALTPTWYDLLGVERDADPEAIRAAWRSAIADLDPTERRFATLNEAAAVLLDPARRGAYDEELRAAEAEVAPEVAPEVDPEAEPDVEPDVEPVETVHAEVEPVETSASARPSSTRRAASYLVPGWVLGAVAVIAVAAAVLAGVLSTRGPGDKVVEATAQLSSGSKVTDIEERAMAAQAAAREAIVPVLSYDYRKLDAAQSAAHGYLTASYQKEYDKLFALIKRNAPGTQTVVTTKVIDSGIVRADTDRVQVLLFVDRPTTNKASTTAIPYQDQVTATMRQVGGDWRIDNLVTTPIQQ
jgi:Mce-associated membrane protein